MCVVDQPCARAYQAFPGLVEVFTVLGEEFVPQVRWRSCSGHPRGRTLRGTGP